MKFYPQPADSPDGVQAWAHEDLLEPRYATDTKATMDPLDSFLRDLPPPNTTFAELKPLEPLDYLTASPDTSGSSRHDTSSTSSNSPGSQYKGAITNNNTFLGYAGAPEPVTTSSAVMNSHKGTADHHHHVGYSITQEIDDIASIIGSAIADNSVNTSINNIMLPESLEPLNAPEFQDIEAFFENMSGGVKVEPADPLIHSTLSPGQSPMPVVIAQASTTSVGHTTIEYATTPTHSPMLSSLLAAGAVTNNNYLHGMVTEAQYKTEISMPILQSRLMQGLKDCGGGGLLKADPMFARQYYTHKDSLPHSTDHNAFVVTTTDDLFCNKLDTRSYLDKVQMASPESTDLSSTKIGLDFPGLKISKGRNRKLQSTKLPIATEGTKDKPVHRCTVCNRGFLNKSNIKVHLRTHTGEKPFKCETCGKSFRQKAHLLKHYQIHKRVTRD